MKDSRGQTWVRLRIESLVDSESNVFFLLEALIDLNQYLGIRLSRDLILSQFPGKSFES